MVTIKLKYLNVLIIDIIINWYNYNTTSDISELEKHTLYSSSGEVNIDFLKLLVRLQAEETSAAIAY